MQSTERALEIARFVIDDDDYVQVDPSSIAEIAAEVAVAVEGLGDLSDYLCSSARYLRIQSEVPRTIRASVKARPYLVYEDGLCSRFKEAEPAAISQHAMANYCRFTTLQRLRNPEEDGGESLEHNKEQVKVQPSIAQETFRDSGIGTSHRHESSYAKSLIGLAKQTSEKFRELIPELSESQLSGNDFNCFMCTRQVRFFNHDEWM